LERVSRARFLLQAFRCNRPALPLPALRMSLSGRSLHLVGRDQPREPKTEHPSRCSTSRFNVSKAECRFQSVSRSPVHGTQEFMISHLSPRGLCDTAPTGRSPLKGSNRRWGGRMCRGRSALLLCGHASISFSAERKPLRLSGLSIRLATVETRTSSPRLRRCKPSGRCSFS
jgi:hypothetical protein